MTSSTLNVLVGLDLGTTSFKAVACTLDGEELAIGRIATPWSRAAGGTTMTAEAVGDAAEIVLSQCLAQLSDARAIAIGVTGMAESGFLVDAADEECGPAYSWLEQHGGAEAAALIDDFTADRFAATTGLPITVRCSIVKLRWMNSRRDGRTSGLRWESLPEWMARRLGGRRQAESSLAARTGLLDLEIQDWHDGLVSWAGLDARAMAAVMPAGSDWGRVRADHPYVAGAAITVAGHDHVCAAVGAGAIRETDVFDSLGTGEAVIRGADALTAENRARAVAAGLTVGNHVIAGLLLLMAGLGTGARLSRVLTELGVSNEADRLRLERDAVDAAPPYVDAEWAVEIVDDGVRRSPLPPRIGEPAVVWRAATEAAGRRLQDALGRLERFSGPHGRLVAAGGWFRSDSFTQTRRTAVDRPLTLPAVNEATGRGAALFAGVAAGAYDSVTAAPLPRFKEL